MEITRFKFLTIAFMLFAILGKSQYRISGQLSCDSKWDSVVYLSAINSFNDFNTASLDFLINSAIIDHKGNFEMLGDNLPESDRIYRLHIVKKEDPVNSIIIGGQEENHIHFIMNNSSTLQFEKLDSLSMSQAYIQGHQANSSWAVLKSYLDSYEGNSDIKGPIQRAYNRETLINRLKSFSDTCKTSLVSLLALREALTRELNEPGINFKYYKNALQKIELDFQSPYTRATNDEIDFYIYSNSKNVNLSKLLPWTGIILVFSGIFLILYFMRFRWVRKKDTNNIQGLSMREREVYELLCSGKSNKQISSTLHIELSTVKSHIANIYAKLGVNSRKELVNLFRQHPESSTIKTN